MFSRGTSEHILHIYGCQAPLHVHRHLTFCAMYNKHRAAVSIGHKADRASALRLWSVSQPCGRGILTSRIWRCVEHTRTDCLCLSLLSVGHKGGIVIVVQLLFCVSETIGRTYRGRNIGGGFSNKWCGGRYFGLQGNGEDYIKGNSWRVLFARYSGDIFRKNEMGGAWGTYGRQKRCLQGFRGETWGREITWKR